MTLAILMVVLVTPNQGDFGLSSFAQTGQPGGQQPGGQQPGQNGQPGDPNGGDPFGDDPFGGPQGEPADFDDLEIGDFVVVFGDVSGRRQQCGNRQ